MATIHSDAAGALNPAPPSPARFLALALAWSVGLFALLRAPWFITYAALPFTEMQAAIARWYGGGASPAVVVTLECSGTDVMALCAGVILAFPVPWARRLKGVAIVLPVLFVLNVIRITTLSSAAGTRWFEFLHVYAWPAVLIAASAGLVLAWMRTSEVTRKAAGRAALLAFYCLGAFAIATPWLSESRAVDAMCRLVPALAQPLMRAFGADATASGPLLTTARGSFIVTPECVMTPIIPLWVMAAFWLTLSRPRRLLALAMTIPVVIGLAALRLLALAAPAAWIESPLVVVHGFHQLVLFVGLVTGAALVGRPAGRALGPVLARAGAAAGCAALAALLVGPWFDAFLIRVTALFSPWAPHTLLTLRAPGDVQGALAMLPTYQMALLVALVWVFGRPVRWAHVAAAAAVLFASQVALLVGLGELAAHAAWHPHALMLRGWAAGVPVLLAALVLRVAVRAGGTQAGDPEYVGFWHDVGSEFPDLGGAASTRLYFENEKRLFRDHAPALAGLRVLKSDLWDEARNTRILQWVQQQGARVSGVDISPPIIRLARAEFGNGALTAAAGDVRALPFPDGCFDVVYSMGTIEHFAESDVAVREICRVLKPGGRAIIGVPNRHDPFLRPLLVWALYWCGLYGYGFEKSYSRRRLRRLLESEGFRVVGDDGILFIPGWLRMFELLCHTKWRALEPLAAAAVRVFVWIDAHVPAVRRHGYLIVAVGERPR